MYTLRQKLGFKMVCPASFFSSIIRLVTAVSLAVTPTYADLRCGGMWNVKGPGGQCHVKMFRKTFGASQKASCKNTGNIIWTKGKNWNALKECRKTKDAINNHPSYDGYPVACDNGDTNKNDVRLDITGYNEALVGYDICTCSAKKIYAIMAGTPIPPCYCQSSGTGWSGCVCPSGQTKIGPSAGSWKCVSSYCPMHPSGTPWSGCTCNRVGYEKYKFQSGGTWYYSCKTCTTVTGKCSFGPCGCMPKGLDINPGFHEKKILKSTENEVCYRCERPAQCNSLEWYDLTTECSTDANCVCDKDGDGGASPLEQLMRKRRKNAADQECYVCADVGIKGELESAVHEGNYVRLKGWACEIEHGRSIEVQVYLGTPSPGTLVPSSQYLSESPSGGVADVCSDKLVRTKCRDTHAVPHNFEIWLDSKSSGKVYVHGIPATTGIYPPKDNEISNSGLEITVPPVDWRQNGVLRGPNDQGKCGASWAFAATHTLQDRTNIQRLLGKQENASKILKFIPDLSVQHMLTCCGNVDDVSNSDTKTVAGATTTTADNTVTSATTSKISKITQATMMATTSASTTNSSASTATELLPSCLKPDDATLCGEEVAYSQCQSGDAMAAILQATCPAKCQICKNADSTTTATSTSTTTATTYTTTTTTKTQTATTTTTTTSQPQLQCHSNDNPCDGGGWVSAAIGFGTQTQFPIDVLHPYTGGSYEASLTKTCSTNSQNYTLDPSVSCAASSEWYECGRDADIVADLEEALRLGPVAVTFLVYNTFFADVGRLTKREARKGAKYVYSCSEKWRRPETLLSTDSLFTLVKDYHAFEQVGSHAVELVGHGVQDNTPYWILKNSWGSKWGDNGYFYMHKGANECDLETRITSYPRTVFEIDRNKTDPDNSRNTTNLITLKEGNDCFGGLEFGSDEGSGDGSGNIGDASETPTTAPSSSTSTGTSTTAVTSTSTTVTTTTVTTTTFTTTTITDTSTTTNGSDTNTTLLTSTSTTITTTSKTTTTLTTTTSTTTATLTTATSTTMTVTSTTTTTITTTTITTTTITTTTTTTLDTFWSKAAQNKPKCLHTVHEGELVKIVNAIASKIETASGLGCIFKVYEVERLEYIVVHGLRLKMSMVVYEVPAPGTNATCNSRAKERHDTEAFMKPVAEKRDVDDEFAETIPYEPWKDVELLRDEPYYCSDGLSVYQSEVDFCRKTTTTTTTATTTTATTTTATTTSATITTTTTKGGEPIRTKLNLGAVSCDDYCKLALNDESALGSRCKAAARGAVSVPFDALPLGCGSNTTATLSNFTSNSAGEVVCIACDAVDYNISEALFVRRNRNSSVTCWCDPPDESQRTTGNPPGNTNPGGSQQPSCTEADPCKIVLDTKLWRKDNVMNAGTGWDPLKLFQTKECGETAEDCACSMDTKCRKNPYVLDGVAPDVFVRKYLRYSGLKSTEVSLFEIPPETLERLDLRLTFSVEWRTIENTAARHGGPGGFDINETDGGIPKGEPQQAGYYHSSIVASVAVTNTLSGGYQPLSQFPIKSFAFQVEGKLPFKIVSYTRNNEACETLTEQENLMKGTTGDDPAGGDADSDQNCESEQQEVKCWHSQSIIDLDDCYAGSTGWIAPINLTAVENQVGSQVTFTLKGAPPGFLINSTTGAVRVAPPRGTPTTPYTVELIGSDDAGSKALVESFVVHVLKRPDKVPDPNNEALIAGVLGSMIVTLLCIVVAYQLHAYRLKMAVHDFEDTISSMLTDGQLDEDQAGDKYVPREIKRSCVTLVKEIGNGAFGAVWKGRLKESSMPERAVAVKTVLDAAKTPEGAEDLLQEAVFMAQVGSHRNVVSMVGVVTSGEPLLLVLELCTRGSLLGVLQEWLLKDEPLPVPAKLKLCVDVAHGMAHLHSKHFIHRDLAARNCLVDRDGVAKVADFGLSRSGHTSDGSNDPEEEQYYTSQNGKFPIRWSAPESFASFRFTFASDAWSFGIVLYECFRNGAKPYKAMKNKEVIRVVQAGYRLPRPRGASNEVYQIMLQCWATIPSNRPPFSVLAAILKPLAELPAQDADGAEEGEGDGNGVNGAVDGGGPIYEQDDSYEEPIAGYEMPVSGYEVEVGTSTRRMVAETSFTTVQNPAYGDPGLLLPDEDESHALVTAVAQFNDEQPAAAPPLPRLPRQYRDRLTSEAEETEDHFTPVGTSWSDDPFAAIAARSSAVAVNVRHLLSSKNVADDLHQHRSLVTTAPQAAVRTNGIIYVTTPRLDRPLLTLSDDFDGPQSRQTSDV